jgi:uncharacterized protein (TIGR02996 family)
MSETVLQITSPAARGLLRAILEDPFDDVPRLLLADVLEEQAKSVRCQCGGTGLEQFPHANRGSGGTHPQIKCSHCQGKGYVSDGQSERAEFMRVQCELATMPAPWCKTEARENNCEELGLTTLCDWCDLRRREQELFAEAYPALASGLPGEPVDYLVEGLSCRRRFGDRTAIFTFRRGFVASVNLTCADWCGGECPCYWTEQSSDGTCSRCHGTGRTDGHGPALVLAAPIEEVNIASVHNGRGEDLSAINNLLREIHKQVDPGAVSNALLAWARQEAGLPPLRP